jgi:serine/threonine-protein kinase
MPKEISHELIGKLALERGFISVEQLTEAVREHERRGAAGGQVPLGEILIEMEFIGRKQLETLLASQGRAPKEKQPIEGFELIRKLGEGGMGATYLARQLSMDRLVALKVLRKNLSGSDQFVERFVREARLAGRLNHVNIVQSQDVGRSSGFHYLVMEYVEGRSAYSMIPEKGGMAEELALHICIQVARALDFAWKSRIVHRDIKPDNILIDADGVAKLCDFGLARDTVKETRLTQTGMVMGTPHYVSPEQARGDSEVDTRSDIYSLGATLYHMVTGQTPFTGPSAVVVMTKHLSEQISWPRDLNPDLSEACCQLIARMMAKDPADRYQTPAELLADMERVTGGERPESAVLNPALSSVAGSGAMGAPAGPTAPTMPLAPTRIEGQRPDTGEFAEIDVAQSAPAAKTVEVPAREEEPGRPGDAAGAEAPEPAPEEPAPAAPAAPPVAAPAAAPAAPAEPAPPTAMPTAPPTAPPVETRPRPERTRSGGTSVHGLRPVSRRKRNLYATVIAGAVGLGLVAAGILYAVTGWGGGRTGRPAPPSGPDGTGPPVEVARPGPARFRARWKRLKISGSSPHGRVHGDRAMTYDSKRGRCVLFGGGVTGESINDLWSLDVGAARWTCLEESGPGTAGAPRPRTRGSHSFIYNPYSDRYHLDMSWTHDPSNRTWQRLAGRPEGGAFRCGLAYDPDELLFFCLAREDDRVICGFRSPTTGGWVTRTELRRPLRGYVDGGLAYDRLNKVFVLFGGTRGRDAVGLSETWTFDPRSADWREMKPPVSPPGRTGHKLVWHGKLGALVVAGGSPVPNRYVNDLWVYETAANRWTELRPAVTPPATGATAYDAAGNLLVLFLSKDREAQTWTCSIERVGEKPGEPADGG